jgi:hypothetical protein
MEDLLDVCDQHGIYAHYYRGRWFVALGDIFGFGQTLPEAIEDWCRMVEEKGLVRL